jgi:hypothetical protein
MKMKMKMIMHASVLVLVAMLLTLVVAVVATRGGAAGGAPRAMTAASDGRDDTTSSGSGGGGGLMMQHALLSQEQEQGKQDQRQRQRVLLDDAGVLQRVLLPKAAEQQGARCLDGSAPIYYFRAGSGSGVNSFQLFFEGGGWCESLDDCVYRSTTKLGSSTLYPDTMTLNTQHFSRDVAVNPTMHNWNLVYLPYCYGASFR